MTRCAIYGGFDKLNHHKFYFLGSPIYIDFDRLNQYEFAIKKREI